MYVEGNTVFVIGAGASKPFGFPIGNELYDKIINGEYLHLYEQYVDSSNIEESKKNDYQSWRKYLNENSVVLFHDTNVYKGVGVFFNELEFPKYEFKHSFGLGVISFNKQIISKIREIWDID